MQKEWTNGVNPDQTAPRLGRFAQTRLSKYLASLQYTGISAWLHSLLKWHWGSSITCIVLVFIYSPALKKWGLYWFIAPLWKSGGYTGFALSFHHSVTLSLSFCHSVILSLCHSVTFQMKILSHFSQELWGLEGWNLVHMWTMGDVLCIPKSCCSYSSLYVFHFSFPFSSFKNFCQSFLGNCEA